MSGGLALEVWPIGQTGDRHEALEFALGVYPDMVAPVARPMVWGLFGRVVCDHPGMMRPLARPMGLSGRFLAACTPSPISGAIVDTGCATVRAIVCDTECAVFILS